MSDSEEEAVERQVKMVLVGAPQVGKTSIALRYTQDTMNKAYQVSAGPERVRYASPLYASYPWERFLR